jgi:paraquat-inducible protein B
MSRKPKPALIGLFVLICSGFVLVAITLWASGRLFETHYQYICYFPGSVNGLQVGSLVKYRGVPLGNVREMLIPYAHMGSEMRVAVVIDLASKQVRKRGGDVDPTPEVIHGLIARGLHAQLQSESLITGQRYVALDLIQGAPPFEPAVPRRDLVEIPTLPSQSDELRDALTNLGRQVTEADLPRLTQSVTATFDELRGLLEEVRARRTVAEISATGVSFRKLADSLNGEVGPTADAVRHGAGGVVTDLHSALAPDGPFLVELGRTLADIQRAAAAIRSLAELLERNPNALIVGRKQ